MASANRLRRGLAKRLEGSGEGSGVVLREEEPLARHTTFRIGGPAEVFAEVAREAAVADLVRACRAEAAPLMVLGLGSNVLVPDEGLRGVVARFAGELHEVRVDGTRVSVGGGLPLARLARRTAADGLTGLEALSGFPSTVGGAVVMNAGCYGVEISDVLERVVVVDGEGRRRELGVDELRPGYRETALQGRGWIVTSAVLALAPGDAAASLARIEELNRKRWASLPSGAAHAGSVFKNPPGDFAGRLIEACGLKGRRRGGAAISTRHANVIVNEGEASADDVISLMLDAHGMVGEEFGVLLEPELVLAGSLRARWLEATAAADRAL